MLVDRSKELDNKLLDLVRKLGTNPKEVRNLINEGANVNASGPSGRNPLIEAVETGNQDVVRVLLEEKANIFHSPSHISFVPNQVHLPDVLQRAISRHTGSDDQAKAIFSLLIVAYDQAASKDWNAEKKQQAEKAFEQAPADYQDREARFIAVEAQQKVLAALPYNGAQYGLFSRPKEEAKEDFTSLLTQYINERVPNTLREDDPIKKLSDKYMINCVNDGTGDKKRGLKKFFKDRGFTLEETPKMYYIFLANKDIEPVLKDFKILREEKLKNNSSYAEYSKPSPPGGC